MYHLDRDFTANEWEMFVKQDRRSTTYHTLEWRCILEDVFHFETSYQICRDGSGRSVGVLPVALVKSRITGKRVVSLPFSQYGGPLASQPEALECMVETLKQYFKAGFGYVRLRSREKVPIDLVEKLKLYSSDYYSRCVIPLAGRSLDDVWKSLDANSVRRSIKSSLKKGVTVEICRSEYDIDRLNQLMFQTCKKHGVPPYSPHLIEGIIDLLVPKGLANIFVATIRGKIIAVVVLFTMNNEAIYAYNFSDSKYLRLRPNNALIWSAIEWSLSKKLDVFDMGISSPRDNELLSFKKRWGSNSEMLHEYFLLKTGETISPERRTSLIYGVASYAWRFLVPSRVASALGPRILNQLE